MEKFIKYDQKMYKTTKALYRAIETNSEDVIIYDVLYKGLSFIRAIGSYDNELIIEEFMTSYKKFCKQYPGLAVFILGYLI